MHADVVGYIAAGWALVPLAPGSKRPVRDDWNQRSRCVGTEDGAAALNGHNIGLAHAYSDTCAVDVDDYEGAALALEAHGVNLDALLCADDAVQIQSGKPKRAKLLYRLPDGADPLPSVTHKDDVGQMVYELRCATDSGLTVQDVLPPSIHPDTSVAYQWGGAGDWRHLPALPAPLLTHWRALLAEGVERKAQETAGSGEDAIGPAVAARADEVQSALAALDPDMPRDDWLRVGMALHSTGAPWAFDVYDTWSVKGGKYAGVEDIRGRWRSFKRGGGVTILTLFRMARDAGWRPPRRQAPRPEPADLGPLPDKPSHHDYALHLVTIFEGEDGVKPVGADGAVHRYRGGIWERMTQTAVEVQVGALFGGKPRCIRKSDFRQIATHLFDLLEDPRFFECAPLGVATASAFYELDDAGRITRCALTPDHRQRFRLPVEPEDGIAERWQDHIGRCFKGDELDSQVSLFQEICGAVLFGLLSKRHMVAMLFGPGRTGKSTALKVVGALIPEHFHGATSPFNWNSEYYIAALAGKRVNMVGELPDDQPIPAADFKRVTGGDLLQGRHPTHRPFEFINTAAHIFNTNFLIHTRDRSDAFFARWLILEFAHPIPLADRVPEFENEIIAHELPQILTWAMRGARRVVRQGFTLGPRHHALMRKWRMQTSSALAFLDDKEAVELDPAAAIRRADLYRGYKDWCHVVERKPMGKGRFFEALDTAAAAEFHVEVRHTRGVGYQVHGVRLVP